MADPGTILNGRFQLDRLIGQGGFARVFLSTDLLLDRQVAVKVLRPDQVANLDTGPFLERFAAEARLIARLEHPNILGLYDYGQSDGLAYLVMPYVAGGSLHDARRRAGRFSPAQTAGYLRQMAAALDYAHRNNVVHRDIKPQNMLLREEGAQLLVADFGIAKVLREESGQSSTAVIGSAAYMAPEQFQGRVGRATDIYALGCVAYELLTSTPPYPGPPERSMFGHVYGELPRLDATLPDAPPALQAVIDRALAKHPDDRFPTAGALAEAFASAHGAPLHATIPEPGEQPTRRLDPPPTSQPVAVAAPSAAPAPPTTPVVPADDPTAALPAAPAARSPSRSLVPWLAMGVAALLVLTGIGIWLAFIRPPQVNTGAAAPPTATAQTRTATQPAAAQASAATRSATATATRTVAPTPATTVASLTGRTAIPLSGHTKNANVAAWSPDGEHLAIASEDNTVSVWHRDGQPVGKITAHTDAARSLAWSPDGTHLATGAKDGFVYIWKIPDIKRPVRTIDFQGNTVGALAWHGTVLVAANAVTLHFVDTTTWADLAPPESNLATSQLAWSPDGAYVAVGGARGALRVFAANGTLVATLQGHSATITSIAWAPTSDGVATAGGNLLLWNGQVNPQTGQLTITSTPLTGHGGTVLGVAWSPDGRTIASGAADQMVRLWDPGGGALATLPGHGSEVTRVAWLADGTLVSGDNRSGVRWWSATGTPLALDRSTTGCGVSYLAPAPAESAVAALFLCGAIAIWR